MRKGKRKLISSKTEMNRAKKKDASSKRNRGDAPSSSASSSPLVRVECIDYDKKGMCSVPSLSLTPDLDEFLFPMKSSVFLDRCLRQQAVHVTCKEGCENQHVRARVRKICKEMFDLDAESILRETSSDNVFVWLRQQAKSCTSTASSGDKGLIQSVEIAEVETAIALHKVAGHATYCRAPPKVEQKLVASLLRATGLGCGQYDPSGESIISLARGEVETFISTPGHVTNWHFDFQENFTIQLSGSKRWTLQKGTIQDPIRGCTPHYAAPEAVESQLKAAHLFDRKFQFGHPQNGVNAHGDVVSIDLKPGDTFYFPAGMWHKVETIEPGVSINVSLIANNYAQVVTEAIQHFLYRFPQWRQPVLKNSSKSVLQDLTKLLGQLPDQLQAMSDAASFIIPPILQTPPSFKEEEEEDEFFHSECEDIGPAETLPEKMDDNESWEEDQEALDNNNVLYEDEEVVDPLSFAGYPSGWTPGFEVGSKVRFKRNCLALVHRMGDVTKFYGGEAAVESGPPDEATPAVFVLNVNFAGNEMHQSAVRVVFSVSDASFVDNTMKQLEAGEEVEATISPKNWQVTKFLVFHGYIAVDNK